MEKSRLNKKQKFGIYYLDENTNKTQKEIAEIFNTSRQTINKYLQDEEMKKIFKDYFKYGFIYAMSNRDTEELFGYKIKQKQYYKVKSLEKLGLISLKLNIPLMNLEGIIKEYQENYSIRK